MVGGWLDYSNDIDHDHELDTGQIMDWFLTLKLKQTWSLTMDKSSSKKTKVDLS